MADNSAAIAQIEEILRAGARQVTVDGTTVVYDFESLRKELRHLKATDDALAGGRPSIMGIKFGNLA
jgi:hypothetical protein